MAKNRNKVTRGRDVLSPIALTPVRPRAVYLPRPVPRLVISPPVLAHEDRRLFHFDGRARPAVALRRAATRLVSPRASMIRVQFAQPDLVAICARRKRRRSVLFAVKKSGRNGMRRSRRNFFSNIGC